MERRVVWGSGFSSDPHELVTGKNAKVASFYSFSDVLMTYIWWVLGCVFCCPLSGDFFMTTSLSRADMKRTSGCCSYFINCMTWPLSTCQDRLLRHLKARGNETVVFTLNETSEFDETEFKYRGHATGVMTDFPTRLMDWAKGKDSIYRRPKLT